MYNHPLRTKNATEWNTNGQILNAFAINLGITGAAVTGFTSTPWTGGTQEGIASPAEAMLLLELPHTYAAPFVVQGGGPSEQTVYPIAIREYWRAMFYTSTGGNNCTTTAVIDKVGAPAEGVVLGMADGSAKFWQVTKFLGATPTNSEYLPGVSFPQGSFSSNCRRATSAYVYSGGPSAPVTAINYPLWGLTR